MTDDPELARWQQEWQTQDATGPDMDALRRQTKKRDRREKVLSVLQVLFGVIVLGICVRAFFLVDTYPMRLGVVVLGLIVIGGTLHDLRRRVRRWHASTETVADLVDLERRRLKARVRYWRESAWIVAILWCALAIVAVIDSIRNPFSLDRLEGWFLSLAVNLPLILATVAFAWWTNRRAQRQHELLDQLEDPGNENGPAGHEKAG